MCLSRPRNKADSRFRIQRASNKEKNMIGYKVFTKRPEGLKSKFYWKNDVSILPIGKWINEKDFRSLKVPMIEFEIFKYPDPYRTGFHCYLTKKEAQQHCYHDDELRKVYMKNILQYGFESFAKVVVAQYIKILGGKNAITNSR